jgi:hypothetical protein
MSAVSKPLQALCSAVIEAAAKAWVDQMKDLPDFDLVVMAMRGPAAGVSIGRSEGDSDADVAERAGKLLIEYAASLRALETGAKA